MLKQISGHLNLFVFGTGFLYLRAHKTFLMDKLYPQQSVEYHPFSFRMDQISELYLLNHSTATAL